MTFISKDKNPANADPVLEATLLVINELSSVMNEEIQLLDNQDMEGVQNLLRRKGRLVVNYQANMKSIAAQPDMLKQAPEIMRINLKEAGTKLAEITEKNATAIRHAAMATQNLIHTIVGFARDEVLPKNSYADPRNGHLALGSYSPTCPPVAVNRTA